MCRNSGSATSLNINYTLLWRQIWQCLEYMKMSFSVSQHLVLLEIYFREALNHTHLDSGKKMFVVSIV